MSRSDRDKPGGHRDYAGKTGRRSRVKWLRKVMNRRTRQGRDIPRHAAKWEQG